MSAWGTLVLEAAPAGPAAATVPARTWTSEHFEVILGAYRDAESP